MHRILSRFVRAYAILICFLFYSSWASGQQFATKINGWNAYVHLPEDYYTSTKLYPCIVFVPGIGETGSNVSALLVNGPSRFIDQGAKMVFDVNGETVTPIVISVQPLTAWPNSTTFNAQLDFILTNWRVDPKRLHLTGLSMGGWVIDQYISDNNQQFRSKVSSAVVMHAVAPNNPFSAFATFALEGGKWWGIEGANDRRKMDQIAASMNGSVSGSALYTLIPAGQTGSTHCCWNTFYDPNWKPNGDNVYTWMLKQSRVGPGPVPVPSANKPPTANAGTDKTITLPLNSVVLTGVGNDEDGSVASVNWSKIEGPAAGTISSPGASSTNVSGLGKTFAIVTPCL